MMDAGINQGGRGGGQSNTRHTDAARIIFARHNKTQQPKGGCASMVFLLLGLCQACVWDSTYTHPGRDPSPGGGLQRFRLPDLGVIRRMSIMLNLLCNAFNSLAF